MTYSVIIPHKNTPDLLQRCVDSIPRRADIQVIVVDDRSDIPASEWDRFRERNEQVCLILSKKRKGGAGYARNLGLKKAVGTWILFADADDYFLEGAFDVLDRFSESDHDVLYFLAETRDGRSGALLPDRRSCIRKFILAGNLDGLRYQSIVPWCKMIRKALIDEYGLRFEEIEASNDVLFSIQLGWRSRNPGCIPETLYCTTIQPDSLVYRKTVRRIVCRVKTARRANDFLLSHGLDAWQIPLCHIGYFLPWHPVLFLWGVWMFRDKRDLKRYFKNFVDSVKYKLGIVH